MTIPNLITLIRLLLVPLIVWLISDEQWLPAFVVLVIAGASDALDGIVARWFKQKSELGAWLDPVADKALLVSIYITLAHEHKLPLWLALVVVARDVFIVGGVVIAALLNKPLVIQPLFISKVNTAAQIILAAGFLAVLAFDLPVHSLLKAGTLVVGVLTTASALAYMYTWIKHLGIYETRQ